VCVTRGWKRNYWELYRIALREPLPTIRVPLRETDPDVPLNLQTLMERCYTNGRYDDLDYRHDPDPPLESHDAAWASELLNAAGRR
jgi:hypothetical protein